MATRIPVPLLTSDKPYSRFKQEIVVWHGVTDLPKHKQAAVVALSLPEDSFKINVRAKVFEEIADDLNTDDGLDKLLVFLDKHLGKDDLADAFDKYYDFESYKRTHEAIPEFIAEFDSKYQKVKKKGTELPSEILAFKLLMAVNISNEQQMFVKSGMDYSDKGKLYEQAKVSLRKYLSDSAASNENSNPAVNIKTEPVFATSNYRGRGSFNRFRSRGRGSYGRGSWRGDNYSKGSDSSANVKSVTRNFDGKDMNPLGPNGTPRRCINCGSYKHYIAQCPHENDTYETQHDQPQEFTLYTQGVDNSVLVAETQLHAVLDSACSSTVCGKEWIENYCVTAGVDINDLKKGSSGKIFKFGGGTRLESQGLYEIPAEIVGRRVNIKTDVVDSDIPLLLSKQAMKNAKVTLDLENDKATIFGKSVELECTSSGHYALPIMPEHLVFATDFDQMTEAEQVRNLKKLHCQFGHACDDKLRKLMEDAGVWKPTYSTPLRDITNSCDTCKKFKRTPARPVVSLPLSDDFNQIVAMDLKIFRSGYILHIIDTFTRFSVSTYIRRKTPTDIIDNVIKKWVGVFGIMGGILTDNGGEFSNEEMRQVASTLGVKLYSTAADSPYQNGICERVHGVIDMILHKLMADYPRAELDVLIGWANMAKNSLQTQYGFSPYQLVFGRNPNLPNLMNDKLPALNNTITNDVLLRHLSALHAARQEFIKSEACEKLRRALRHKTRLSYQHFEHGDSVYYKRDNQVQWLGPARVIAQDGKLIFVRHGGQILRVAPGRLIRCGSDISASTQSGLVKENMISGKTVPVANRTEGICEIQGSSTSKQEPTRQIVSGEHTEKSMSGNPGCSKAASEHENTVEPVIRRSLRVFNQDSGAQIYDDWDKEQEVHVTLLPKHEYSSPASLEAKHEELDKLMSFDTYEEVPDIGQPRISTRFVMTKKNDKVRARLVARGFEEESVCQSDSPTVSRAAMRVCISIAVNAGWEIETTDIKSAFLQSRALDRNVYVTPPVEANCPNNKLWKLKRGLYGLSDAAREFYMSLKDELLELGCQMSTMDNTFFYFYHENQLSGVLVSHIDDFLHAGNNQFEDTVMKKLRERFLTGKRERKNFTYVGFLLTQDDKGVIIDQNHYAQDIEQVEIKREKKEQLTDPEMTQLRSIVGALNWVVQGTRPDSCFSMLELSTKFKQGTVEDLLSANKLVARIKQLPCQVLYPRLKSMSAWKLAVFTDAAFANLPDGVSSTQSYVIFLVDESHQCCVLDWKGNKIKRVARSTLAAEALALQDGLEAVLVLRKMIKEILPRSNIPIVARVDCRSLVEAIHSTHSVNEKLLRINIASIKQLVVEESITVSWIQHDLQLADSLTKRGASGADLLSVLQTGRLKPDHSF